MKEMDTLLTIIVPAYNVERYISECLDSIINQTVRKHKIIIVNDGSKDGTEEICLTYQRRYPEIIKYIYQENKGLGEARNTGMKLVETPYLCFLDSDDWLNIKYVEKFSQMIEVTDELPDIVFTLPWIYNAINKRIYPWMDKDRYDHIFNVQNEKSLVKTNGKKSPELFALEVNACRKIYRTDFLKKCKFTFPKAVKWEDVPGHFYLIHKASVCMALPEVGFMYRMNHGGQITAGSGKSRLDMIPVFRQLLEVQEKNDFNETEKIYVLRLIVNFSIWSIDVTNLQYIQSLLSGLHDIFKEFDDCEIERYLNTLSPNREREAGIITLLRGDDYLKLKDYLSREKAIEEIIKPSLQHPQTQRKKNLLRGGIQCVCDHGISYTIIWTIRKYLLKKTD